MEHTPLVDIFSEQVGLQQAVLDQWDRRFGRVKSQKADEGANEDGAHNSDV